MLILGKWIQIEVRFPCDCFIAVVFHRVCNINLAGSTETMLSPTVVLSRVRVVFHILKHVIYAFIILPLDNYEYVGRMDRPPPIGHSVCHPSTRRENLHLSNSSLLLKSDSIVMSSFSIDDEGESIAPECSVSHKSSDRGMNLSHEYPRAEPKEPSRAGEFSARRSLI